MNEIRLYPWELESMCEYSTTVPTGVIDFKFWRCDRNARRRGSPPDWCVCQYVPSLKNPGMVSTRVFEIALKHGPRPRGYSPPDWDNFRRYSELNNAPWTLKNHLSP